jgi:tRNA (mo5U34)-methyltransferase
MMGAAALNLDEIRQEVARLGPWHHDVEVVPGLWTSEVPLSQRPTNGRTPTTYRPHAQVDRIVLDLFGASMEGRSFLDVTCNGGGHALAAARLGAGRCYGFDARADWVAQARFLANFAPHADMQFEQLRVDDLPAQKPGRFDVTLFSGIFYHLPDPVHALRIAADHTGEFLIVNTAAKIRRGEALFLEQESAVDPMSGMDDLAWLPSGAPVLRKILAWCGFPASRLH